MFLGICCTSQSISVFFVAEVLPDHRGQNTGKGRLTQACKEKWRQALRGFGGTGHRARTEAHPTGSTSQHWRTSNVCRMTTPGLWDLHRTARQTVQDSNVGHATGVAERLSFVEMSELLLSDGATRVEFNWADPRRSDDVFSGPRKCRVAEQNLHTHLTQGFRGWYWCDAPHRRHGNRVDSIKQAGLSFCRTEWSVVSNAASAPFDKAGFFCRYAEAAKEFLDNNDCTNDLFLAAYPILSLDQNDVCSQMVSIVQSTGLGLGNR